MVSTNTKAILLLTAPLIVGRERNSAPILTLSEYNQLARALLNNGYEPGDLLEPDSDGLITKVHTVNENNRLMNLLGRGFLLSQAIERWESRSIWVVSHTDEEYPKKLKERLKDAAPAILYGCGDNRLLETGGLAIVGSRNVDEKLIKYTEKVGNLAARAQVIVISGGAKGIDRAAMFGALQVGGQAVGIVADSLERLVLGGDTREYVMDNKLVLISPYDPAAGFDVGNAMQRNKSIYALSDVALVVNSDYKKGGTWAGAVEQLDKFHFVPVFIRTGDEAGYGLQALGQKGALPWPNPETPDEISEILSAKIPIPKLKILLNKPQLPFFEQPEQIVDAKRSGKKYKTDI